MEAHLVFVRTKLTQLVIAFLFSNWVWVFSSMRQICGLGIADLTYKVFPIAVIGKCN